MIREARAQDIPAMVGILAAAKGRMGYDGLIPEELNPFDGQSVARNLATLMARDDAAVFVCEESGEVAGTACVALSRLLWNADIVTATEVFWHMAPHLYPLVSGRKRFIALLDSMLGWAQERGAVYFVGITPPGPAGKLFERRGFRPTDTMYGGML